MHNCRLPLLSAVAALACTNAVFAQASFNIIAVPDTQFYSESVLGPGDNFFDRQIQWIVDNRTTHNILFASHLGDVVNHAGTVGVPLLDQWDDAVRAMNILKDSPIPFGVLPGNHDWTSTAGSGSLEHYRARFGDTSNYFAGKPWFLGFDARGINSAQLIPTPLGNILHLSLEYNFPFPSISSDRVSAPAESIAWAQQMIDAYPGVPTILATHNHVNASSQRDGAGNELFRRLVRTNDQVFMVLNGHYHGEGRIISNNDFGRQVFELNSDYQSRNRGGDGWLRLYTFEPANNRIRVRTYTPISDAVNGSPAGAEFGNTGRIETDADSQFTLPINFAQRFAPPPPQPQKAPQPVEGTPYTIRRILPGVPSIDDTEVRRSNPAANLSAQGYIHIDTDDTAGGGTAGASYGLIKFNNLFGPGVYQLPDDRDVLSAKLRLYVHEQRSNAEGSGFEVRRMLVPWSNTTTWNSLTLPGTNAGSAAGIAANGSSGFEAFANPDGFAGGNAGGVGVAAGQWLEFDVKRSVLAWRSGQANYGWLLQTFPSGSNGTRVETSDSELTGAHYPELIITPTKAPVHTRVFTTGVDTRLNQASPNSNYATATSLIVDAAIESNSDPLGSDEQSLIKFDNVFGSFATQVPQYARVSSAVLTLHVNAATTHHDGTSVGVHRMLRPWSTTETWNTAGPAGAGISIDNIEAAVLPDDSAGADVLGAALVQAGLYHFDVTESLRNWAGGGNDANYGWALIPTFNGTNAIFFDSFDASAAGTIRPKLTVRFTCTADFNADGSPTVQDIFDYLTAWFANDPNADINNQSGNTVQDIFSFLAAWFAGC